jgi:hypothetical protein
LDRPSPSHPTTHVATWPPAGDDPLESVPGVARPSDTPRRRVARLDERRPWPGDGASRRRQPVVGELVDGQSGRDRRRGCHESERDGETTNVNANLLVFGGRFPASVTRTLRPSRGRGYSPFVVCFGVDAGQRPTGLPTIRGPAPVAESGGGSGKERWWPRV